MTYSDAVLLGIIQGLTEFLPISSSGHLVVAQHFLGLRQMLAFDVFIHLGTLAAVVTYYRREVANMALSIVYPSRTKNARRLLFLILVACIPTAVIGLGFQAFLEGQFESPAAVGIDWIITAGLLFAASRMREGFEVADRMPIADALLIGLFQGIAILPGVSRSGSTLAAGVICGLRPKESANFSFLLSIPAILGATLLQFNDLRGLSGSEWNVYLVGGIVAAIAGYAAIWVMLKLLQRRIIQPFAWYCVIASLLLMMSLS